MYFLDVLCRPLTQVLDTVHLSPLLACGEPFTMMLASLDWTGLAGVQASCLSTHIGGGLNRIWYRRCAVMRLSAVGDVRARPRVPQKKGCIFRTLEERKGEKQGAFPQPHTQAADRSIPGQIRTSNREMNSEEGWGKSVPSPHALQSPEPQAPKPQRWAPLKPVT